MHCLLRFLRRKVCKIDPCVLKKCINSIFFLHSLTHSCKFKFSLILFEWASIYANVKVFASEIAALPWSWRESMPRWFLCYLFNYCYTWLCSNTAVYATSYGLVPENIYTPTHGGHFCLKPPPPWKERLCQKCCTLLLLLLLLCKR